MTETPQPDIVRDWYLARTEDAQHDALERLGRLRRRGGTKAYAQRRGLEFALRDAPSLPQRVGEVEEAIDFFRGIKASTVFTGFLDEALRNAAGIGQRRTRESVSNALRRIQGMSAEDMYEDFSATRYDRSVTGKRRTSPQYPGLSRLVLGVAMTAASSEPSIASSTTQFPNLVTARDAYTLLGLERVLGKFPVMPQRSSDLLGRRETRSGIRKDLGVEFSMEFVGARQLVGLQRHGEAISMPPSVQLSFRKPQRRG
jgi:hypothetical protein